MGVKIRLYLGDHVTTRRYEQHVLHISYTAVLCFICVQSSPPFYVTVQVALSFVTEPESVLTSPVTMRSVTIAYA